MNMNKIYKTSMSSGPRIYSFRDNIYFYGACHLLTLSDDDRGKTLNISVDAQDRPICWIELWKGTYDGGDVVKWTTQRGQFAVVRSAGEPQPNPSITWTIEPGDYTIYFVSSSRTQETSNDVISYRIQIN
jgi:hypothetical protein